MKTMKTLSLEFIIFLCKVFLCGFAEESPCTPGLESKLLVFKVHRDHLYKGKPIGRVNFNTCDGRTTVLFQSLDKRFDMNMDGTVTLKRPLTLQEGSEVFSVHAWDANGKKHTVSIRVEFVQNVNGHHKDTVMNITHPQMELPSDRVLTFPKSSTGLKRMKRGWVIPPISVSENSKGPFPLKLVQIKSDYAKETPLLYSITGEGADQDPVGIFTVGKFTGILFVTQPLDREKKPTYKLIVHAKARDVANIEENPMEIVIQIIDQNDNKPEFTQNPFNGHVQEAATIDYEFMTVTATDADDIIMTDNGIIRYSIVSQEPQLPKPNMFEINSSTGGIFVRETGLDRGTWSKYTLLIVATDVAGNGYATTGTAVITITDSNDNPPQFEQTLLSISVPEDEVGHIVVKLTVTDGDEVDSPAWSTKYQIISGDEDGFFNVSTGPSQGAIQEGIITTVKPLDFEKTKQFILSVIVENDDPLIGSFPTSTATVTVNVEERPKYTVSEKEEGTAKPMFCMNGTD